MNRRLQLFFEKGVDGEQRERYIQITMTRTYTISAQNRPWRIMPLLGQQTETGLRSKFGRSFVVVTATEPHPCGRYLAGNTTPGEVRAG